MIFPRYRHTPIFDPERKRCPVCHQSVYSLAGIHPQCAIKRAEALELLSKRAAAKSDSIEPSESARQQVILADYDCRSQAKTELCN
jgi:hypothetical protein